VSLALCSESKQGKTSIEIDEIDEIDERAKLEGIGI